MHHTSREGWPEAGVGSLPPSQSDAPGVPYGPSMMPGRVRLGYAGNGGKSWEMAGQLQ